MPNFTITNRLSFLTYATWDARRVVFICATVGLLLTTPSGSAEPTRGETVKWLTEKMNGYECAFILTSTYPGERHVDSTLISSKITSFTIDSEAINFTILRSGTGINDVENRVRIVLKDLRPVCKVAQWTIPLTNTTANESIYHVQLVGSRKDSISINDRRASEYSFTFTEEELATRISKALEHLIALSGGQAEPF